MTNETVTQGVANRYAFPVYENGTRIEDLIIEAGNHLIAALKAPRRLGDGQQIVCAIPRLLGKNE